MANYLRKKWKYWAIIFVNYCFILVLTMPIIFELKGTDYIVAVLIYIFPIYFSFLNIMRSADYLILFAYKEIYNGQLCPEAKTVLISLLWLKMASRIMGIISCLVIWGAKLFLTLALWIASGFNGSVIAGAFNISDFIITIYAKITSVFDRMVDYFIGYLHSTIVENLDQIEKKPKLIDASDETIE